MTTRLRHRLRTAADRAARWSGVLARREREGAGALTVLTYHRVLAEERAAAYPFANLALPLDAFREQVRWLVAHYSVVPLGAALAHVAEQRPAARPLVALTFDDGYADSADEIANVLDDAGVHGTFFVTTGFVGTRELLWFDRAVLLCAAVPEIERRAIVREICGSDGVALLPARGASAATWTAFLKTRGLVQRDTILLALERAAGGAPSVDGYTAMSVAELVSLHARGHEIGSHTVTHARLPDLDEAGLRLEIEGARDTLATWLGVRVAGFCYPNGDVDARVAAAVARAGHTYACTTRDGVLRAGDDPLHIRRVDVVPERALDGARRFDATALRREMCGLYRRAGRARSREPAS